MPHSPRPDTILRAAAVIVLALALLSWRPTSADDAFMYAATGRYVVDHRSVPHTDPLSWTAAGEPWQSNGWLWGVVSWEAYDLGGPAGLAALNPLLVVGIGAAAAFAASGLGARRNGALVAAVAAAGGALFFAQPRPHMASYACFGLVLGCAARAAAGDQGTAGPSVARRLAWTVATFAAMVAWANLHSVAPFGVLAVGVAIGGRAARQALVDRAPRAVVPAVLVTLVAAVGVIVTPFGLEPLRHASEVRAVSRSTITEWFPLWRLQLLDPPVVLFAVTFVVAGVVVRRYGWRARPELVALVVLFAALAADANRNVAFLVLSLAVVGPVLAASSARRPLRLPDDRRRMLAVGAAGLLACSVAIAGVGIPTIGEPEVSLPTALVDGLPSGCRLLNDRHVGGFVLLRRPDVPVSADGRNDLYGTDSFVVQTAWFEEQSRGGDPADLDRAGITCVLFRAPSAATALLDRTSGWTRLVADGPGVAFVRARPRT